MLNLVTNWCDFVSFVSIITMLEWLFINSFIQSLYKSKRLWDRLKAMVEEELRTSFILNAEPCLLGTGFILSKAKKEAIDLLCILTKHYIHRSTCNNTTKTTRGLELYIKTPWKQKKTLTRPMPIQHVHLQVGRNSRLDRSTTEPLKHQTQLCPTNKEDV